MVAAMQSSAAPGNQSQSYEAFSSMAIDRAPHQADLFWDAEEELLLKNVLFFELSNS